MKGFGTLSRFWFWYREEKIDDQRNLFMVLNDRQFTVFCREVGFVEIYAFLVLIFLAKYVSLLFLLLFPSLYIHSMNFVRTNDGAFYHN